MNISDTAGTRIRTWVTTATTWGPIIIIIIISFPVILLNFLFLFYTTSSISFPLLFLLLILSLSDPSFVYFYPLPTSLLVYLLFCSASLFPSLFLFLFLFPSLFLFICCSLLPPSFLTTEFNLQPLLFRLFSSTSCFCFRLPSSLSFPLLFLFLRLFFLFHLFISSSFFSFCLPPPSLLISSFSLPSRFCFSVCLSNFKKMLMAI